ncbi:MAG: hypothetical protein QOK18_4115 [Mycobacterium sp.]|jgi:hypothetical protein|nr:hypothetical protein [Mycobacterium sp.]
MAPSAGRIADRSPDDARYSYSSERNRLLLLAMVHAWGNKCYWCRTPKTFRHLEIDHIAPRSPRGDLDPAFDVDAAENLAPICGPCNKEKSNGEFQDAPASTLCERPRWKRHRRSDGTSSGSTRTTPS